jgi:pSer/pThr/pTyr-binding forkhead associated (FHA) protein
MTTTSPVGPFTLTTDEDTDVLAPQAIEDTLDALPLLDARLLPRTIAPHLALRGHYLALGDGDESRLLRLDRDVTHLGRGSSADIRFDEYRVSRDHAILVRHGRHVRILDNRSANGTFVNGRRIVATNISAGDVIDLGPVRIQLIEVA